MNQSASTPHMEPTLGLRSVVFFGLADESGVPISDGQAQAIAKDCRAMARRDNAGPVCASYSAKNDTFKVAIGTSRTMPAPSDHTVTLTILVGADVMNQLTIAVHLTR